jgi:hypothetical protein
MNSQRQGNQNPDDSPIRFLLSFGMDIFAFGWPAASSFAHAGIAGRWQAQLFSRILDLRKAAPGLHH